MTEHIEYDRLKGIIEPALKQLLPMADNESKTLNESMLYSLSAGGKRIRPVLLLASCELCDGDITEALPYACAIEYIHTYSLIHDDLPAMDDDKWRRGKPTNHIVFGEATAILAGDGLLTSAMDVMMRDISSYTDDSSALSARINAFRTIADLAGIRGMIGGQIADIEAENKTIEPDLLDYIHYHKTAALIIAAVTAGAYIAKASEEDIGLLAEYAENLGLAFQIVDDLLDVHGDEMKMGKSIGRDGQLKKSSYPSIHGMDEARIRLIDLTQAAGNALEKFGVKAEFLIGFAKALSERTM